VCLTDHSLEVSCYRLVNCLIGFGPFLVCPLHSKLLNWGVPDGSVVTVVPFRWVGSKTIHVCRSSDARSVTADTLQKGLFQESDLAFHLECSSVRSNQWRYYRCRHSESTDWGSDIHSSEDSE